jgi:hypothetical protein
VYKSNPSSTKENNPEKHQTFKDPKFLHSTRKEEEEEKTKGARNTYMSLHDKIVRSQSLTKKSYIQKRKKKRDLNIPS